jgi:hypothetical protein
MKQGPVEVFVGRSAELGVLTGAHLRGDRSAVATLLMRAFFVSTASCRPPCRQPQGHGSKP